MPAIPTRRATEYFEHCRPVDRHDRAFLWGNRLLPYPVEGRADLGINLFFSVWAFTLLHASVRPARSAWVEQLWAASELLFLLPVLDAFSTQRPLWHSLIQGDWVSSVWVSCAERLHCSMLSWLYGPAGPSRSAQAYGKQARFDRGRARERAA